MACKAAMAFLCLTMQACGGMQREEGEGVGRTGGWCCEAGRGDRERVCLPGALEGVTKMMENARYVYRGVSIKSLVFPAICRSSLRSSRLLNQCRREALREREREKHHRPCQTHTHTHTPLPVLWNVCVCVRVCVNTHTHMHTCTHAHTISTLT